MSDVTDLARLNPLVEDLATRTKSGAVTWEPTEQPDAYVSATAQGSVSIAKTGGTAGARRMYHLAVLDESGNRLAELASLNLSGLWSLARTSTGAVDHLVK